MKFVNTVLNTIKRRSPVLLSSSAILGVGTTAYLTGRASFEAVRDIDRAEWRAASEDNERLTNKEKAELVWKLYIPAAASGVLTCVCIVGGTRIGNRRAVAAIAAFNLSERAYHEYRDKVIEEFGEKKDEKIRAAIATDRVHANPPPSSEVLFTGPGNILCCELHTGRYFASDMETLRRKVNDLNAMILRQDQVSMEEWYYMLGLGPTSYSSDWGWTSDRLVELEFSTILTEDGRPCLAFDYNYHRVLYDGMCP
jgi:hypothetical protein